MSICILVCGGRKYDNPIAMNSFLDAVHKRHTIKEIVHGDASGADRMAGRWAENADVKCTAVPADWKRYGRSAGPIRNAEMLKKDIDIVVAFPGGRGTADMINRAEKAGVKVFIYDPNRWKL